MLGARDPASDCGDSPPERRDFVIFGNFYFHFHVFVTEGLNVKICVKFCELLEEKKGQKESSWQLFCVKIHVCVFSLLFFLRKNFGQYRRLKTCAEISDFWIFQFFHGLFFPSLSDWEVNQKYWENSALILK